MLDNHPPVEDSTTPSIAPDSKASDSSSSSTTTSTRDALSLNFKSGTPCSVTFNTKADSVIPSAPSLAPDAMASFSDPPRPPAPHPPSPAFERPPFSTAVGRTSRMRTNLHVLHLPPLYMFRIQITEEPRKAGGDHHLFIHDDVGSAPWPCTDENRVEFRRCIFGQLILQYDDLLIPPNIVFHGNRFAFAEKQGQAVGTHPVMVTLENNETGTSCDKSKDSEAVVFDVTFEEPVIVNLHDFDEDFEISEEDELYVRSQLNLHESIDIDKHYIRDRHVRTLVDRLKRTVKRDLFDAVADIVRRALRQEGLHALELAASRDTLPPNSFSHLDTLAELVLSSKESNNGTFTSAGSIRSQMTHTAFLGGGQLQNFSSSSSLRLSPQVPRTKARIVEGDNQILLSLPYSLAKDPTPQSRRNQKKIRHQKDTIHESHSISSSSSLNSMLTTYTTGATNPGIRQANELTEPPISSHQNNRFRQSVPQRLHSLLPSIRGNTGNTTPGGRPKHRRNNTCMDIGSLSPLENLSSDTPIQPPTSTSYVSMLSALISPSRNAISGDDCIPSSVSQQHGMLRLTGNTDGATNKEYGIVLKSKKVSAGRFKYKWRHDSTRFGLGLGGGYTGVFDGWACLAESSRIQHEHGAKAFISKILNELNAKGCDGVTEPMMINSVPGTDFTEFLNTICQNFTQVRNHRKLATKFNKPVFTILLDDDFCEDGFTENDAHSLACAFLTADIHLGVPLVRCGATNIVVEKDRNIENKRHPVLLTMASRINSLVHGCNYNIGYVPQDFFYDPYEHHVVIGISFPSNVTKHYIHSYAKDYNEFPTRTGPCLGTFPVKRSGQCVVAAVAHDLWLSAVLQEHIELPEASDNNYEDFADLFYRNKNPNPTDDERDILNMRFVRTCAVRKDGNVSRVIQDVWNGVQAMRERVARHYDIDLARVGCPMPPDASVKARSARSHANGRGVTCENRENRENDYNGNHGGSPGQTNRNRQRCNSHGKNASNHDDSLKTSNHEKIAIFRENGDNLTCESEIRALLDVAATSRASSSSPSLQPEHYGVYLTGVDNQTAGSAQCFSEQPAVSPPSVTYVSVQRDDVHGVRLTADGEDLIDPDGYMDGTVIEAGIVRHDRFQFFIVPFHERADRPAKPTLYHVVRFLDRKNERLVPLSARAVQQWVYSLSLGPIFRTPMPAVACISEAKSLANRVGAYARMLACFGENDRGNAAEADDREGAGGTAAEKTENDFGKVKIHPNLIHKPFYV